MPTSPLRRERMATTPTYEDSSASSSTLFTETATGWHVFKVGYSKTSGVGVARRLKSCPFVVGGHTWCIAYFPNGVTEDTADCITFALRLEDRAAWAGRDAVTVRATFSLHDVTGGPMPSLTIPCGVWTFSRIGQSCCHARFMERMQFELSYVKDDEFCIRCDVTVLSSSAAAPPPPPDLRQHLGDLLASGDGADVTLDVGSESFRVHKNVLAARSPVFMAEFFGGPHREKAADRVSIDGIEPSVFRALLHFIYTDSLPDIDGGDITAMAQHLLVAADRYCMERLKSICELVLRTFVDKSAVVTTLVIAEQHGCPELKQACVNKVLKTHNELMVGEDFRYLASTCPSLLLELYGGSQNI